MVMLGPESNSNKSKDNSKYLILTAEQALQALKDYILGTDYCIVDPVGVEHVNAIICDDILLKCSRRYRLVKKHSTRHPLVPYVKDK